MPNESRRTLKCSIEFNLGHLALLHRYYLAGMSKENLSEERKKAVMKILEGMENILTRSGYMSRNEIKQRHDEQQLEKFKRIITDPYSDEGGLIRHA